MTGVTTSGSPFQPTTVSPAWVHGFVLELRPYAQDANYPERTEKPVHAPKQFGLRKVDVGLIGENI
jgi:hypothetical protein